MAKKASADQMAADMRPPNYREAVQRLKGIVEKKTKIASVNGDIATIYSQVEGLKVDKRSARIFMAIDKFDPAERLLIMRDINGLMDAAGWEKEGADLVDRAAGNVVAMRLKGGETVEAEVDDDLETELAQVEEGTAAKAKGRARNSVQENLEKARQHFTGDNSDLKPDDKPN